MSYVYELGEERAKFQNKKSASTSNLHYNSQNTVQRKLFVLRIF
jgi:hypothetical protein